jgi:gamma-tubulin complex component 2
MLFYVNPTIQVFSILKSIVTEIMQQDLRGGQVLSLLHEKAVSMVGDATGQSLCFNLAQKACMPYFVILENWIYKVMSQNTRLYIQ